MIFNLEATHIKFSFSFLIIISPCCPPWNRTYLAHDLYLLSSLPLLSNHTNIDTVDITFLTATAIYHNPLLFLLGSLSFFFLFLGGPVGFLFGLTCNRSSSYNSILSFESVVDEKITALLDVQGAAWLSNPVETKHFTLPVVVANQLPLSVPKFKYAWSQHQVFLNWEVEQGIWINKRLRCLLWLRDNW